MLFRSQNVLAGKDVLLTIGQEEISLNQDNLLVTMQGLEGFAFAGEGERGVVLDTTITPELKEEGYLREVISKIQNLSKDSGLEVSDRIEITLNSGELIADVFKKYEEIIARETLADKINYLPVEGETSEVNINGEMINLAVEKAK